MCKYNILAIFSNHTYNNIKYNISFNNISYIIPHVNDIIIVDSIDEEYAIKLKTDLIHLDLFLWYLLQFRIQLERTVHLLKSQDFQTIVLLEVSGIFFFH